MTTAIACGAPWIRGADHIPATRKAGKEEHVKPVMVPSVAGLLEFAVLTVYLSHAKQYIFRQNVLVKVSQLW